MLKTRPRTRNVVAARTAKPATARSPATVVPRGQVCIGVLVEWDDRGPAVDFEGNTRGPVRARVAGSAAGAKIARACSRQEVVLLVDGRPSRPPVLLGLLQPLDAEPGAAEFEARVDGRRVELDGRDEIVLRCGDASITLRRNGRILISGVQVETRARGVNRIRGGSVAIN